MQSKSPGLTRKNVDPNPLKQFEQWFQEATEAEPVLPEAVSLATATRKGRLSSRMVLLKDFDETGFVFYTNYESRKGLELAENPNAALVFLLAPTGTTSLHHGNRSCKRSDRPCQNSMVSGESR